MPDKKLSLYERLIGRSLSDEELQAAADRTFGPRDEQQLEPLPLSPGAYHEMHLVIRGQASDDECPVCNPWWRRNA